MIIEIIRYAVIGIFNTIVGYCVFLIFINEFGFSASISNTISYAIGIALAYILNAVFVFKGAKHTSKSFMKFALSFLGAYSINIIVLKVSMNAFFIRAEISQIFAMASYTVVFYILNKFFVWRD